MEGIYPEQAGLATGKHGFLGKYPDFFSISGGQGKSFRVIHQEGGFPLYCDAFSLDTHALSPLCSIIIKSEFLAFTNAVAFEGPGPLFRRFFRSLVEGGIQFLEPHAAIFRW
jgi:hypothetical protein